MTEKRQERLAVLIDADNTSPAIADGLFAEIAKIGEATVRRIYGDFSKPSLNGWAKALPRHAILPSQNFPHTPGKNATDIVMVIEAMDLLHSERFDGFCLVSSDSDFTRLAARIREEGLRVYGFGEEKTPESLRTACHRFFLLENLRLTGISTTVTGAAKQSKPLLAPSKARPIITQAINQIDPEGGWVALGGVGSHVLKLAPDFDPRTYGFAKLSSLVEKAGEFEVQAREGGGIWVRMKVKPAA